MDLKERVTELMEHPEHGLPYWGEEQAGVEARRHVMNFGEETVNEGFHPKEVIEQLIEYLHDPEKGDKFPQWNFRSSDCLLKALYVISWFPGNGVLNASDKPGSDKPGRNMTLWYKHFSLDQMYQRYNNDANRLAGNAVLDVILRGHNDDGGSLGLAVRAAKICNPRIFVGSDYLKEVIDGMKDDNRLVSEWCIECLMCLINHPGIKKEIGTLLYDHDANQPLVDKLLTGYHPLGGAMTSLLVMGFLKYRGVNLSNSLYSAYDEMGET